jgi:hypothetical protein
MVKMRVDLKAEPIIGWMVVKEAVLMIEKGLGGYQVGCSIEVIWKCF